METILPKTSGWVAIDGLDIDIYPNQIKQTIGIQLQEGGFFSKLNLVESLSFFADIYNVSINPSQFLEKFGLLDKAKNTVEELSGGQRQLFSIASTLVADPTLIFLDEPTTGLDPQARRNLWQIIENFKKQDKTVVLTTHYMEEAQKLCDRVAIMDLGKIIEINTTEGFIQELENKGFKPQVEIKTSITLEDVFLDLTGKQWRS
jgi:ABC-2 type transport system ATP-binding protein